MPFTPGPWKVHNDAPHGLLVMQDDSVGICRLWQDSFCPADPMANALLIAAAPDLPPGNLIALQHEASVPGPST